MVLEDYKRDKNKLINPFDAKFPNLNKVSYLDDTFPNIFWIALLYKSKGLKSSINLINTFMQGIDKVTNKRIRGLMYEFYSITDKEWILIKSQIGKKILKEIKKSLSPLLKLYPECPINKLFEKINITKKHALEILLKTGANLSYKPSKIASLSMGLFVDSLIKRQILSVQESNKENFNIEFLENNWDSERARTIRPSIRATIIIFLDKTKRNLWSEYFWKRGFEISKCDALLRYYQLNDKSKPIKKNHIESLARNFSEIVEDVHEIHEEVFNSVKYSPDNFQNLEIKLGLFNRVINLSKRLLRNFEYWNDEVGKMIIRSIIDSYILLIWFQSKATEEDLRNYREYGLGKKKLLIEHFKSKVGKDELTPFYKELEEELNKEIETIVNPIFLDVNIGDWKDKSTRDIAIEIGEKEIFDYLYNPFSDIVHGGYSSLEQYHLRHCYNPLHKGHKIPKENGEKLDFMIPLVCLQVLIKTLKFGKDKLDLNIKDNSLKEMVKLYKSLINTSFHKRS